MYRHFTRLVFSLFLIFGAALSAFAQSASICGKVTDPCGTAIASAQVQVINEDAAGKIAAARTDKTGSYLVQFLPAGRYEVIVRALGFNPDASTVTLTDGQKLTHDVQFGIVGVQSRASGRPRSPRDAGTFVIEAAAGNSTQVRSGKHLS